MEGLEIGPGELKDPGTLIERAWFGPSSRTIYQGKVEDVARPLFNIHRQAALPSIADISAVNVPILLQEIIGLQRPQYNLRNACRTINMNALKATIPIYTKGRAQEKVPPLTEASLNPDAWGSVTFALWKNVMHIVVSDELQKIANVDIFGTGTRDAAGALAASENAQIAEVLDATTESIEVAASGLWTALSSGRSQYNPYTDINSVRTTIAKKGYRPNAVVMSPLGWSAFFGNDYVKGQLVGATYPDTTQPGGFPLPGLPNVTGFSDYFLTPENSCYVVDQVSGMILGAGPTEAARYRNEAAGYDAYIMRQWLQPQAGIVDALGEIEGVYSTS